MKLLFATIPSLIMAGTPKDTPADREIKRLRDALSKAQENNHQLLLYSTDLEQKIDEGNKAKSPNKTASNDPAMQKLFNLANEEHEKNLKASKRVTELEQILADLVKAREEQDKSVNKKQKTEQKPSQTQVNEVPSKTKETQLQKPSASPPLRYTSSTQISDGASLLDTLGQAALYHATRNFTEPHRDEVERMYRSITTPQPRLPGYEVGDASIDTSDLGFKLPLFAVQHIPPESRAEFAKTCARLSSTPLTKPESQKFYRKWCLGEETRFGTKLGKGLGNFLAALARYTLFPGI